MAESPDQSWVLVPDNRRPLAIHVAASLVFHCLLVLLVLFSPRMARVRVRPATEGYTLRTVSPAYLPAKAKQGASYSSTAHVNRRRPRIQLKEGLAQGDSATGDALHELARQETRALTMSLNFHGVYLNHEYKLAVQISGDVPVVAPEELPPHFQSYVIVEVTIDVEGKVAEARTVAGIMTTAVEQKLLSAIRKFKYNPATRDGFPIPSQRDIVIHIPT